MQRNSGINYAEALSVVLRKDVKLSAIYHRPPARKVDPLAELESLADYLNGESNRNPRDQDELVSVLRDLKHKDAKPEAKRTALIALERMIVSGQVRCEPIVTDNALTVGVIFSGGHRGTLARALHDRTFSALHCCRWCRKFFVDKDYRRDYCSTECFGNRETARVKHWRAYGTGKGASKL
jgi:hypothetical protein